MTGQEAFESFKLFHAIRLHFTSKSYDFVKFRGKTKVTAKSFDKRHDTYFFYKLWKRYKDELKLFYVSVFINGGCSWAGELLDDKYHTQFNEMLKRQQSLTKVFSDDVKTIVDFLEERELEFSDLIKPDGGNMPMVVRLCNQGFISIETLTIINRLTKMSDRCSCYHPGWDGQKLLLTKYVHFVDVSDLGKFAKILKDGIDVLSR